MPMNEKDKTLWRNTFANSVLDELKIIFRESVASNNKDLFKNISFYTKIIFDIADVMVLEADARDNSPMP